MTISNKLTLKLKPETAKVMPWLIANKLGGKPDLVAWAKNELHLAEQKARQREKWEREREIRELEWEEARARRRELDALNEELDRELAKEARREQREHERWLNLGFPFAYEEGFDQPLPAQSNQKGWRRLISEHADLCDWSRYGQWGRIRGEYGRGHRSYRNEGRKPRTPWFK